jgi:hypothetical protein
VRGGAGICGAAFGLDPPSFFASGGRDGGRGGDGLLRFGAGGALGRDRIGGGGGKLRSPVVSPVLASGFDAGVRDAGGGGAPGGIDPLGLGGAGRFGLPASSAICLSLQDFWSPSPKRKSEICQRSRDLSARDPFVVPRDPRRS